METLLLEKADGIAWLTLNRPEVLNAFNWTMQEELRRTWRELHVDPGVRVIVLTGAGERAFCTGVDRESVDPRAVQEGEELPGWTTPWTYVDPGLSLGPKANECWKPVIAAVNGMAAGGAFYMLGEVEFIIAADHATFFEPHLNVGIPAVYEPIHLVQKIPFQEVMRMALLGSHERMSAQRAFEIGLVSQVVPKEDLRSAVEWAARAIAAADPLPVMGTVRAIWNARDVPRRQALDLAYLYVRIGQDRTVMRESMERFASGGRVEWRLR
ncbi:MAG TPA: enoyl-CoA hydratase/isomerase family protein [Acidimicrobiales bacterium]|nr:enoyl-CoA hydratase/isomerase family protein [Acidimicrobiales bacterium]